MTFRSAYILKQESLPPSYKSFLNKHGGKDPIILQAVKDIASGIPFTNLEAVENYYYGTGVKIKLDPSMKVPCSVCVLYFISMHLLFWLMFAIDACILCSEYCIGQLEYMKISLFNSITL